MIKQSIIENVLEAALSTGGDFSEVFIEDKFTNTMELQSGKIEKVSNKPSLMHIVKSKSDFPNF